MRVGIDVGGTFTDVVLVDDLQCGDLAGVLLRLECELENVGFDRAPPGARETFRYHLARGEVFYGHLSVDHHLNADLAGELSFLDAIAGSDADYVALSFVRSADDVRQARALTRDVPIIAKIEVPPAVEEIESIVSVADGDTITVADRRIAGVAFTGSTETARAIHMALAAKEFPKAKQYVDWRKCLEQKDIDAVVICSSTDTHTRIIEDAAAARKHVFCEKPIDFDLSRIDAALAAADQAGIILQIGFNRRFDASFQRIRQAVASGEIGKPHQLHIISRDPAPPPREYLTKSGGIFMDMTIHDFDMARFLMGCDVEEIYVFFEPQGEEGGPVGAARAQGGRAYREAEALDEVLAEYVSSMEYSLDCASSTM